MSWNLCMIALCVCVCVCVCEWVSEWVSEWVWVCVCVCVCVWVCVCVCACVCVQAHVCVCVCVCVCVHAHTCMHVLACTHACVCECVCVCVFAARTECLQHEILGTKKMSRYGQWMSLIATTLCKSPEVHRIYNSICTPDYIKYMPCTHKADVNGRITQQHHYLHCWQENDFLFFNSDKLYLPWCIIIFKKCICKKVTTPHMQKFFVCVFFYIFFFKASKCLYRKLSYNSYNQVS